jgi:hypothetical protein
MKNFVITPLASVVLGAPALALAGAAAAFPNAGTAADVVGGLKDEGCQLLWSEWSVVGGVL